MPAPLEVGSKFCLAAIRQGSEGQRRHCFQGNFYLHQNLGILLCHVDGVYGLQFYLLSGKLLEECEGSAGMARKRHTKLSSIC